MYRLLFQSGVGSKEPLVVHAPLLTIGRDASCQLPLLVKGVAEHHARIERRADGYYLRDLNSPNGVSINDRLVSDHRLASGDEMEIGSVRMRFEIIHELPGGQERRPLDLLQLAAVTILVLVIGGQFALLGSIFSQTRTKKMNIDAKHGWRGQQAMIASESTPLTTPSTSEAPPPLASGAPAVATAPVVLHRMIRIVRVDRSESANVVAITVQAKAQVGERELDPSVVGICVQFAALDAASNIIWRDPIWVPIPAWENFASKGFTVRFPGAPKDLAGFVVRTYYRNQLQDVAATPPALQALAPAPSSGGAS